MLAKAQQQLQPLQRTTCLQFSKGVTRRQQLLPSGPQQLRRRQFSLPLALPEGEPGISTVVVDTGAKSAAALAATAEKPPDWEWEGSDDALRAYGVLGLVLLAGLSPVADTNRIADLPYFISLAICSIYIGAHRGLTTKARQQISIKEGLLAPVFASVSLFGFYLVLKFFPDLSIQTVLNAYFFLLGTFALVGAFGPCLRRITGPLGDKLISFDVPDGWLLDEKGEAITKAEFSPSDVLAVAGSLAISWEYINSGFNNFTANNLIACLIATDILQLVGLRSFRTAGLLLMGLLCYDVFWVFYSPAVIGENVMLTVATSEAVTGPTRLLFPRSPMSVGEGSNFPFSLLGLGDVAIPGLLACLALRFDASRSVDMFGRAQAAGAAIQAAIAELKPGATGNEIAEATADAMDKAYDAFADRELRQKNNTLDGTNANAKSSSSSSSGAYSTPVSAMGGDGASDGGEGGEAPLEPVPVSAAVLYQRTYFWPVMWAYGVGLMTAFAANSITEMGQPALLYLCPCTLGAVALTAAKRKELGKVWRFTDVPTFGVPEKDKKEKKKDDK